MALTATQTSISDLFAPRANSNADSRPSKKRDEQALSGAGDFGAMVADYSAMPQAKATRKETLVDKARDSKQVSRRDDSTRDTHKLSRNRQDTSSTKRVTQADSKTDTSASKQHVKSSKQNTRQESNTAKAQGASGTSRLIENTSVGGEVLQQAVSNTLGRSLLSGSPIAKMTTNTAFDENALLAQNSTNGKLDISGFDSSKLTSMTENILKDVMGSTNEKEQVRNAFNEIPRVGTLSELKAVADQKLLGQQIVGQKIVGQLGLGQEIQGQISKLDSLNPTSLFQEFDVQQATANVSQAEDGSKSNNLKALDQLSSVKSIAPNVMRAIGVKDQGRRPVTTNSSKVSPLGQQSVSGVASDLIGVNGANTVTEVTNLTGKQSGASANLLGLQNPAIDEGLVLDGKNVTLDGTFQLQSSETESIVGAKAKAATSAGKLVIPEKIGSTFKAGMNSLKLQISPENLGKAQLTVKLIKNHVQGTLTVSSEAARVVALNSLDALAESLSKEGLTLDALNVEVSSDGAGQGQEELERRYNDMLQSGLVQRAFDRSDDFTRLPIAERIARPLMMDVVGASGVNALA